MDMDDRILYLSRTLKGTQVAESPSPSQPDAGERRRELRVRIPERCPARLQLRNAHLVNISSTGVLVEHTNPAWPGQLYRLSFSVRGVQVELQVRAIHAFASNRVTSPGGKGEMVFRTGMEFFRIKNGIADLLLAYIDQLRLRESQAGQ
jgi:hypothetical protein